VSFDILKRYFVRLIEQQQNHSLEQADG